MQIKQVRMFKSASKEKIYQNEEGNNENIRFNGILSCP